ncbi:hypothetical protein B4U79_05066 [Dinothrombium tinctorium]|uniref:Uncharacterized protein n=1 Tax=Dinothrombium tinctorium TaxID=1965070 RepID=A0A3S3SDW1_9ACAR|nr:hypothetical protein B4U79_05066 [Dinothrombium tinctorium]
MSSNQLFSTILNPLSQLSLDLTEIEKEEKEVNAKISEMRKELDYIDSQIHKYEGIRASLVQKMSCLQIQKDTCLAKRKKVVQKMLHEKPSLNCHESYSKFDCLKITDRCEENQVNEECDEESKALDNLVAGLLKTLNEGVQAYNAAELAEATCIKEGLKYSNGSGLSSLQSLRITDNFFEKSTDNAFEKACNNVAMLNEMIDSTEIRQEPLNDSAASTTENNEHSNESNFVDDEWPSSASPTSTCVSSQAPRFYSKNQPQHKVQYNSVLALEASVTGYIYKSLNDSTVMRYRFANVNDNRYYRGHSDKVKVLFLDPKLQLLYTGCDDGKVRCFNTNTGSILNEFLCDGNLIAIEKFTDSTFIFGTNKGWIYLVNSQFELQASHRTFNWIFAVKSIISQEKDNHKKLIVIPMKHKPTVIDAVSGKILQEINSDVIESRPCIQVNGSICILATVIDKNEPGKSSISVFDTNNWKCIQTLQRDGIVSSLCTRGTDLYIGIKYPAYGHIQCFKWANRILTLKWVACVAYVHTLAVMPSDIVLNGGPDGNVYNTTPNLKGPFLCSHKKCNCKLPFARRKDLEFHYSKLPNA